MAGSQSMDNKTDINALTRLIEITVDSADGYEEAIDEVQSSTLKTMLCERSNARRAIASTLQECVRALGGEPDEEGAALASAHRSVLRLPTGAGHHDTRSVVEEARRDEAYLKAQFDNAMHNTAVSPHTRKSIADARRRVCAGDGSIHDVARVMHG